MMRSTYTYAMVYLSSAAYQEIKSILESAGYKDQIDRDGVIDMHGLAVQDRARTSCDLAQTAAEARGRF